MVAAAEGPGNWLIAALPARDRARIVARCEAVNLVVGDVLCEWNKPFRHVYFPLTGLVSVVAATIPQRTFELGLIGREGMLGATLALGIDVAPLSGLVHVNGLALRMSVTRFRRELRASPVLLRALRGYLYLTMTEHSMSAACNAFHEISSRLARRLLLVQDRSRVGRFHLTHKALATALGVRRSGISVAAGALRKHKVIHYSRGEIEVLDRRRLEAAACRCYRIVLTGTR
jgi:CRP-like cAMP-binding protein